METTTNKNNVGFSGKYRFKKFDSLTGEQIWIGPWIENLVVSSANHGLGLITQRIIGLTTYDLEVTQAKIGTGTTAPVDANTDLETITLSGIIRATQSATATTATIDFFIPASDLANGTYTEFGLFCGAQLFARSIITPSYTKSTNEDTGVEYIITATNT